MNMRARALATLLAGMAACGQPPSDGDSIRIAVPRGATLTAVANTLQARGIVESSRLFRLYARVSGSQRGIQAGIYDFAPGMSMGGVLQILVSGREALQEAVIPEGLMLSEVADLVHEQLGIPVDSFLLAASDTTLLSRLGVEEPTLEGYLYPSTYYVRIGVTANALVSHMVDEFLRRWKPEWDSKVSELGLSRHELVTLASIIEGEVRYPPDREYVSSVYHNRLQRGMRLQADPTVIYALGHRRRLYQRDYQTPSDYNTYLIDGLPPGPIGQPSEASLTAALYPLKTDFFYFVARPDGKHVFSRTHREHLAAIREVRRMEAELGMR
jgi:UPF0755 protein